MKKLNKKILLILFAISNLDINILNAKKKYDADYIIVGLGTAGSVLARYLSDPVNGCYKNSVLVLEAGRNLSQDEIIKGGLNVGYPQIFERELDPKYSVTQVDYNPNIEGLWYLIYSAGRMWFGTSAHNEMWAVRGTADVYDEIAKIANNDRWTYNNLLPFMKQLEHFYPNSPTEIVSSQRGLHGPLEITQFPNLDTNSPIINAISQVTNTPFLPDYNISSAAVCISPFQAYVNPKTLNRSYGYNFLPESILSFDGHGKMGRRLRVISEALAEKVLFKCKNNCKRAIGVRYVNKEGCSIDVYAKKKVILCAGSPLSSAILQRSGIGPSQLLNSLDIPIIVANENVGKNLIDQFAVAIGVKGEISGLNNNPVLLGWLDGYPTLISKPDGVRRFQFVGINNGTPQPDIQANALGITTVFSVLANIILRPTSRGYSKIISKNPAILPNIVHNPYSTDEDKQAAIAALYLIYDIIKQARINVGDPNAFQLILPSEESFISKNYELLLLNGAYAPATTIDGNAYHYTSTCQMGTSIENGVVDGNLHVFGVKDLMVADNSIYPLIETGNTAWTAYLAGIIAANILGWKLPSAEAKNIDLQESETLAESANLNMNQMSGGTLDLLRFLKRLAF